MHIRRRMTYTSAIIGLLAACTTALALFASTAHAAPNLTGRANVDFAVPGAFSLADDSIGRDVGLPSNAPLGTVSGWDMSFLRLFYDSATDVLFVGIQTFGIGGDADGDGDEGTTSLWLASVFGADLPLWEDTESFALMLDIDEDGIFDVVAGVPATGDVTTYTVAQFDGLTSLPGFAFGAPLGDEFVPANPVVGPATFTAPHIEFRISSFSQLPGFGGTVGPFRAKAFMGSLEDSGIGEDRIPNGNDTAARVCFDSDGDGYSTCDGDCDDSNAGASPGNLGDPICDLVDEDCDGKVDEDFGGPGVETSCGVATVCQAVGTLVCVNGIVLDTCVPGDNGIFVSEPTACGVGACAATGATTCATGSVTDTCSPGVPAPLDGCNGIDDDCDGATDEGFVADVTYCGVGVCQRQGLTTCIAGVVADTCVAGEPAQFEVCNGLDDNCNGTTDDAPVLPNPPTCGLGECATVGSIACVGGEEIGTCEPPVGSPELCDGLDNDCDGDVDNDPSLPPAPTCGVGECATVGSVACEGGSVVSVCVPPVGAPEICDGLDNDCDGTADDGIAPVPTSCGVGACAASGLLTCTGGALVDSCVAGAPSAEVCDGADNNCDGSVDEGIDPTPTACGTGACAAVGSLTCVGGSLVDSCAPGAPSAEVCDGADNNCNGSVDEGIDATPTTCGVGACAASGELACTGGSLVDSCTPGAPSAEVCDGADNNCDGSVDEGIAPTPTVCGTGACASTGELACAGGTLIDSCAPGAPSAEICDGADNDCDGAVDNGIDPTPTSCGLGACAASGQLVCTNGSLVDTCTTGTPSAEVCDGADNNCDGSVDEGIIPTPTTCGAGACSASGELVCTGGSLVDTCVAGQPGTSDSCDGADNDCDGATDEDFVSEPTSCGLSGCASTGETTCIGGVIGDSCVPGTPGLGDPICDGVDDDCDGKTDEDFGGLGNGTTCGSGPCAAEGVLECVNGVVIDTCVPGPVTGDDADCDLVDNDCDGSTDESFLPTTTSCGVGACAGGGVTSCTAGVVSDSCTPGGPTGSDDDCDGVDDDCDGATDESFVGTPTSCGVGVCAATGTTVCVSGAIVDTCSAGAPTGGDADCDAADNDCDGSVDESFVGTPTACGVGACASSGVTTCAAGVIGDDCAPGSPTGGDADCDATDNDCDGATDESFVSAPTSCGVGACASTGATTCTAGVVGDTCSAGAPTGGDADCDATDNDCDGSTDESFVGTPTICGVGACVSTGGTVCVAGVIGDSCSPGSPTGGDADCDATDNDCDGATDESFVSTPTSCGSGVCVGAGELICDQGTVVDTCSAPPGEPESCNGADDNCNGQTDEGTTGVYYTVTQGAQTFQIAPIVGTTDVKSFYSYDSPNELSSNTGFEQSNRSVIGLYRDPSGKLSLFMIHDAVEDGTGGEFAMTLTGLASGTVVVQDDPSGAPDAFGNPNGEYSWKWPQCCTDGVAIEGIGNAPCFTVTPGTAGGIAGIDLLTGAAGGERVALGSQGAPFEICAGICCEPDGGADADCDGVDNDCDGETDESFAGGPSSCGVGACAKTGEIVCVGGQIVDTCTAGAPTGGDADCDATDNDCDGATDESFVSDPTSCGVGACASTGMTTCTAGVVGDTCSAGAPTGGDADCDSSDNDCDGSTDESFVSDPTSCGVGACASTGTTTCTAGVIGDTCSAGAPTGGDADCDATDNDCDGATDESFVSAPTSCGVGACASTGMTTCTAGVIGDTCSAGAPGAADGCDGADNDCDGATDEDFVGSPTSCGVGACASTGTTTCTAGVIGDTCSAGTPGSVDGCDGADNDCDGTTDEDFVGSPTSCGVGACASTGTTTCTAGVVGDTCSAGAPTGGDADCDSSDNDCDGSTDESFVSDPTSCGVGACASTGMTTCTAGVIGDTCSAGAPTGGDADCDATDNDCDGATDESFVSAPTSCGVGACASTGMTTCTAGVVGDTCSAGTPGAADGCDGADNDCDGATDEDFVGSPTSCGVGACASTGTTTCTAGVIGDTCSAGTPGSVDGCDGADNDCDGTTDEDFVGSPTSCGVGACASTGTTTCVSGVIGDTCSAGAPTGGDADCDATDNDCDGSTDESFVSDPTSCGVGACASTGTTTCISGVIGDTCSAGAPTGGDADCDATDNDCDGATDESFVSAPTSCGVGACASTGMTTCTAGVVGDTCSAGTPGSVDGCDGADNDCDGTTDEDFIGSPTSCGVGACASTGTTTCISGVIGDTCSAGAPTGSDADCDSTDNDCDGATDEDFVGSPTSCGVGACASTGTTTCTAGVIGDTCSAGAPTGGDADCDAIDNDCDGATDESFVSDPTSCGVGACASTGMTTCTAGVIGDTCSAGTPGAADGCDGADNDCDGATDEDFAGSPTSCGVGACASTGTTTCIAGVIGDTCSAGAPTGGDADCDAADNDCDGATDESFVGAPTSCGVGVCASSGLTVCVGGVVSDSCAPGSPSGRDSQCDGKDNDCDGATDEAFVDQPTTCGSGACSATGIRSCVDGVVSDSCTPGTPGTLDACDGTDNDCDGATDEDFVPEPTSCGIAVCTAMGATTCIGGVVGDSCVPGTPGLGDPFCDGVDEDCDGQTDEDFGGLGVGTTCGAGICASEGVVACIDGQVVDTCTPGPVTGDDSDCDLIDNDCDSATDESFVNEPTTCGFGACAGSGTTSCANGVVSDSCAPGSPTGNDDDCDGVDDDCDGSTDESFVGVPTSCGVGVCASTGTTTCIAGVISDTCTAGAPTGGDADCDSTDNDCDGSTDESFVSEPTSCGVGVCASTGNTTCTAGVIGDNCSAGSPTGGDADCDATDNDCDGSTDESFVSEPTSCGVGVCASTGTTTCIAGVISDTCTAGAPTGGDADCDSTDNDCDGSTDESFVSEPTSCGVGVCASTGNTTCKAGVIGDNCSAGSPTGGDADCDATDNDCDGSTDESFVSEPTSCGTGVCASTGDTTCTAGVISDTCTAGAPTGGDTDCDSTDNDCDGSTDESFVSEPTSCGVGVCASTGNTTCKAGVIGDNCSAGSPTGGDADCDAADNDCDGSTDESFVSEPTSCGTGVCASTGDTTCTAGVIGDTCTAGAPTGGDADCDSTDNDCDGATDESFVSEPTSCGVGVCASTGNTTCKAGVIGDNCSAGSPTGGDADCDAADNDCDGSTDESFVSEPTSCGTGVCASTGDTTCTAGVIGDTCTAGAPTGDDTDCDSTDNDCDGATDESFVSEPTSCGTGVCASTGNTTCTAGVVSDTCAAGAPTGDDADCDATDNDCDGSTDESFVSEPTSCGTGVCASTGDTTCTAGVIGDTCAAGRPTGDDADCDATDNDCDGSTDESFVSEETNCGLGVCAARGLTLCTDGQVSDTCSPGAPIGSDSNCDSIDDDCDGATDESFVGAFLPCGVGVCANTSQVICVDGTTIDTCVPGLPTGGDADCDATDNDCDGSTDESFMGEPTSCGTGACASTGTTTCTAGVIGDACLPGAPTGDDADCDGVDNDCDGATDESFVGVPTSCGVGVCASTGTTTCTGGVIGDTCTAGAPTGGDTDCDSTDNDCDGATDESFVSEPTSCGTGVCASTGNTTCTAGVVSDTCAAGAPTGDDADCDATDNDCDGSTDESFVSEPTSCGTGVCASTGDTTCTAGVIGDTCAAGRPTGDDADCDATDNDCDGSTDESFVSEETNCGLGVCAARGLTLCTDGQVSDTCSPGAPIGSDSNCDSIDDDCDGATDESFVGAFLPCGVGVCANTSQVICVDGTTIDTCVPGLPTGGDADCDATDNDCDGSTDESFVGEPTSCGTGACASTGTTTCTAGVISDACLPGAPTGGDADCDGVDNDCDGATDESFVGVPTSCGVGVCASTGTTTCSGGVIGDTCTAGAPTGGDTDCDSTDNDCDGATDESFVSEPTSCGTGACSAMGATTCVDGVVGDTCAPGQPTGSRDKDCNGVDDDCDGSTDEAFASVETSCGVGVCANRGLTVCVDGVQSDTCAPGAPSGPDTNCDSVDDDCDGSTDESFVGEFLPCGVGACATTAQVACVDGATVDTCSPSGATGTDDNCNGVDDDCDGATDEAFLAESTTCGVGECHSRGVTYCSDGTIYDSCEPGVGRPDVTCDGADDDCDGSIDEGFVPVETSCGEGACHSRGVTYCAEGAVYDTCVAGAARPDANCNGVDDDCDGDTDEAYRTEPTICGDGECYNRGMTACVAGAVVDTCEPKAPTDEICQDGIDQDCDGQVDNGCECPAPAPGLVYAVASAHSDECHGGNDMHAISLPGFFDGIGTSETLFSFNDDALFEWSDDGLTARVVGSATVTAVGGEHADELGTQWWVDVLVNYRGVGAFGEGTGGPVLALASSCQPPKLTSAWDYFDMLDGDAVIARLDDPTDFALFTMFPVGGVHPMQLGYAANNKNAGMGLSAGLEFIHYKPDGCVTTNTGAMSVDLDCP
jgi:hypothetical protein